MGPSEAMREAQQQLSMALSGLAGAKGNLVAVRQDLEVLQEHERRAVLSVDQAQRRVDEIREYIRRLNSEGRDESQRAAANHQSAEAIG